MKRERTPEEEKETKCSNYYQDDDMFIERIEVFAIFGLELFHHIKDLVRPDEIGIEHGASLEYVGDERSQESLERYYRQFTKEELKTVKKKHLRTCRAWAIKENILIVLMAKPRRRSPAFPPW